MTTTTLAVLVPLLPFLGAVAILLVGRRAPGFVQPLAVLPVLASAALAVLVAVSQGGGETLSPGTRLTPTGSVPIDLAFYLDGFAVLVAVAVAVVATGVQLYSTGYLRDDPRYPSYAALVSLFTAAMLLVVYSGDLMVLLVGWEVMGVCSYFLVGHYWETAAARSASLKAFLVTKAGDVPFLIGLFVLAGEAGTFRINGILTAASSGDGLAHPTVTALLLLAGVAGKSAQFPLHTWLPSAMAGPTPVSALIHAATMVAAGVYFVARLLPVFTASAAALAVLAVMAAVTMAGSALAALAQDDIKRVLAYSTLGQLGYMTGALALGERGAAVFHLLTHGAFKALLFLGAGVLIHVAGTNSLAAMSRMPELRRRAPDAYWTMTVALLALAAMPPFSGFFSKEAVLGAAEHAALGRAEGVPAAVGWTVLAAGLLTALLTAAYATRLWLLMGVPGAPPATGSPAVDGTPATGTPAAAGGPDTPAPVAGARTGSGAPGTPDAAAPVAAGLAPDAPHPTAPVPVVMNAVLWVLFLPAAGLGATVGWLPGWFDGTSLAPTLVTSVLGTGLALVGILLTYATWRHTTALARTAPPVPVAAVPAHPGAEEPARSEAEAIATHEPAYGSVAAAADPADPGRLLLGRLHRHAAAGFHADRLWAALAVRPTLAAAALVRRADRDVVERAVRAVAAVPGLLGALVRRAQTGNAQTYLAALLAGSVLLAAAAVLLATGTGA
ncbi:NADH-quinone oxidoreductase subunit 5 family protein [Streptomyces zingiberis]|uniref:NADH-quinone oxidoreductase subunit 5 family protein n=1 Tax=Streptomyces zingiberis TaxID=2053010 RepID=UPI0028935DBB|nr:NADH-quinone oxidoreductase subunit L [Streptomyces zingiberis]